MHVGRGQIGEQRPLHGPSLCNGGDIRNVVTANDAPTAASYAPAMRDRMEGSTR
jgi:hypothetical protein